MKRFKTNRYLFYQIVFFFGLVYVLYLILDYGRCYTVFDFTRHYYYKALANGPNLVLKDFGRIFDLSPAGFHITQPTRFRYFQDLFLLINFKFRIWLFNYIPPHPSLSLAWLFPLLLSPLFFFKLIYNLTSSRKASWIGVILFYLSTGSLSGITLLSNPAKPLTIFFAILCFYLASKISLSVGGKGYFTKKCFWIYIMLLAFLLLSFFTDETAYFLYICIPILFPAIFGIKRIRVISIGLYLLLLALFLIYTY